MEFLIFVTVLYFLPAFIAVVFRHESDAVGIFLVNFLLGWTIVGWWVALIWALASNGSSQEVRHASVSSGRFCSQCGRLSPYSAHFCSACGHAV